MNPGTKDQNQIVCPICDRAFEPKQMDRLYEAIVCRQCISWFADARLWAGLIDVILYAILFTACWLCLHLGKTQVQAIFNLNDLGWRIADFLILGIGVKLCLIFKDSIRGRSIGKVLLGVKTVSTIDGQPIGFAQGLKRNLWILCILVTISALLRADNEDWSVVLSAEIFIQFSLFVVLGYWVFHGRRWGDRWAKTNVVWLGCEGREVFVGDMHCDQCGYHLHNMQSRNCPECGQTIPTAKRKLIKDKLKP